MYTYRKSIITQYQVFSVYYRISEAFEIAKDKLKFGKEG